MKNIILTGFMGTGKSSVGKELALRLNYRYIDLDALIVAEAGISINEIFVRSGEAVFRSLESKILVSLKGEEGIVLSTGGGAVIADENRHVLHTLGAVINLSASAEEILHRLQHEHDRPLLNDDKSLDRIRELISRREPFYADADFRIETSGRFIAQIVDEILLLLKRCETRGEA
ncbi:shikimate kinase [Geobacter sp. AOG1]|uniref:shikimate kinase n=1 Tax=Geobacter sp. AOG1 TaxID=1566346 RepID=UPI001CC4D1DA|nr:shikimate kinase [Geobacter sp. AOG1]GFE58284.1 shikimate kinase [Geobacter sp. AOG1]